MPEFIVMPKLGFDMREGVLNNWLKNIGDQVTKGDVVAEIESDKATLELESQVSGVLLKYLAEAGDVVPIGANLAIVGQAGEDVSALAGGNGTAAGEAKAKTEAAPVLQEAPEPAAEEEPAPEPTADGQPTAVGADYPGGAKATPVARRIAQEHKIDLRQVTGSGPEGRIRKADVEAYLERPPATKEVEEARPAPAVAPAMAIEPTPVPTGPDTAEAGLSRLRQVIARRMTESKTTVPHFYVTTEIDMKAAMALRKQVNTTLPEERKVTVNDVIVKAAALALHDFPNLNASFAGDKLVLHNRINIGSAVAVEGGLLTVVQKDTDTATLSKVAAENKAMIARAREGKSRPEDFDGATFTVSNLGTYDVDHFIAIINPPNAAILAVGSVRDVPVVVDGQLAIGTRMKATISADHRVTDGAEAARYMQAFKALLEEPLRLLL
jgi:pyruvate dehydrogenase E2 component (dihydrolipoamide acetyltransferase)